MTNSKHEPAVLAMMQALYTEDPSATADPAHFPQTIRTLLAQPMRGSVILFFEESALSGYSLLVPYLSNEFGGNVLVVDELFVQPHARNHGIAKEFFRFLFRTRPFEAVAIILEVTPSNSRARRLYESLGFESRTNTTLLHKFPRTF